MNSVSLVPVAVARSRLWSGVANQLGSRNTTANDTGDRFQESALVAILPLVEPKRLLVQVAEQVERLNGNISALESAFQQRPKVFETVRVDLPVNVGFGVV